MLAVYAALLMVFSLFLELNCFIMEAGGFTFPIFVKLFRRYGILHFFAVLFTMISAGLWFGFSEKFQQEMANHPHYRGSKVFKTCIFIYSGLTGPIKLSENYLILEKSLKK